MKFGKMENGNIIKVRKGMNSSQEITCIYCGGRLKAENVDLSKDIHNISHFSHVPSLGVKCSYEKYLNELNIEKFKDFYLKTTELKVSIVSQVLCDKAIDVNCVQDKNITIDIKKEYPLVRIFPENGVYGPACILSNVEGEDIIVRINYQTKTPSIEKSRGIPIIQIDVKNEETIEEIFFNREIDESDKNIVLYNFGKLSAGVVFNCAGNCVQASTTEKKENIEKLINEIEIEPLSIEKNNWEGISVLEEETEKESEWTKNKELKDKNADNEELKIKDNNVIIPKPDINQKTRVQVFRPKRCFSCKGHPEHYMNIGNIWVDEDLNMIDKEIELFKDEITENEKYSIAKRTEAFLQGDPVPTNSYFCPNCGSFIANSRLFISERKVYRDELILLP